MPSIAMSVAPAGIDPGAAPPTSEWWARLATYPSSSSRVGVDGAHDGEVGKVGPAPVGVVDARLLARLEPAEVVEHGAHAGRHRPQVHRDVLRLGDHLAVRTEHRGRAVRPLLDVGRVGGTPHRDPHLVGDPGEGVTKHLELHRGEWALRSQGAPPGCAPDRRSATSPGWSRVVVSGCSIRAGPSTWSPVSRPAAGYDPGRHGGSLHADLAGSLRRRLALVPVEREPRTGPVRPARRPSG